MRSIFLVILLLAQGLYASSTSINKYLEYLTSPGFGHLGDFMKGEMQIVDNKESIDSIEEKYYQEFIQKGCSPGEAEKYSRVGVVDEDRYWIWFRDPLVLPNGKTTAFNRFFPKSGLDGAAGVSVMGINETNEILVNIIFRHATREWEIELPRGGRGKNESSEQAALRELEEETGVQAKSAFKLGSIASDSGILSNVLDIFVVHELVLSENIDREDCEAIDRVVFMTKQALKQAFVDGFIEIEIAGYKTVVFCRDPFLATALLIAEAKLIL